MSIRFKAVTICKDKHHHEFTSRPSEDYSPDYCSCVLPCKAGENHKFGLDCIGGLRVARLCSTKKEAAELVEAWNAAYKANGEYLFDSPAF